MTTIKEIQMDLYPVSVYVLCTTDINEVTPAINKHCRQHHKHIKPNFLIPEHDQFIAFVTSHQSIIFLIILIDPLETNDRNQVQYTPTMARIIAHEAVHVMSRLLMYIGAYYSNDNDEFYAYPLGHITGDTTFHLCHFLEAINLQPTVPSKKKKELDTTP